MTFVHKPLSIALGLCLALTGARANAQVTGVPGINDYTLNGFTSGSTSCTSLCFPSPVTLTMAVHTAPGNLAIAFWTDCPCRGCSIPWPPNACAPSIPLGSVPACSLTNQSIDFFPVPSCSILFSFTMVANSAGFASTTISVPLINFGTVPCAPTNPTFSTQAVVLDLCGNGGVPVGPGPFVLTQAYDVGF